MNHSNAYTITYATILAFVCASLLTGMSEATWNLREKNKEDAMKTKIMAVLGVDIPSDALLQARLDLYDDSVEEQKVGDLSAYAALDASGAVRSIAFLFEGKGRNGPIKGCLALDPKMETIQGITFYQHKETPGLGGEIEKPAFTGSFVGKKLVSADGTSGIRIGPFGKDAGPNEVDTITGATVTCDLVQVMLNEIISSIVKELAKNGG